MQVLFLDNIDLRTLNKKHTLPPRIKVFDQDSLRRMTTMCASRGEDDYLSFTGVSMYWPLFHSFLLHGQFICFRYPCYYSHTMCNTALFPTISNFRYALKSLVLTWGTHFSLMHMFLSKTVSLQSFLYQRTKHKHRRQQTFLSRPKIGFSQVLLILDLTSTRNTQLWYSSSHCSCCTVIFCLNYPCFCY